MFDIIRISAFKDNYIWLLRKGGKAIVVDPGDARPVLETLEHENLTLEAILITHHHHDHQDGITGLLENYPALVFGPSNEPITALTRPLTGGETIQIAGFETEFRVLSVPGHTAGHLAYYGGECLFCGDTLFGAGCGRVFEGTMNQMHHSLMCLASLPEQTQVYCAHEYTENNLRFALAVEPGNRLLQQRVNEVAVARAKGWGTVPFSLAIEKATNPFLRCDKPEVVSAAQKKEMAANKPEEVFSVLRQWKNNF